MNKISGFSKLSKNDKIKWIISNHFDGNSNEKNLLKKYWNNDKKIQRIHDDFSENTISNYYMPMGIAPNFNINDQYFTVPMVTEESSVVAAASYAANFWFDKGGFKAKVQDTEKIGEIYFLFDGETKILKSFFKNHKKFLLEKTSHLTKRMKSRGGGIINIQLFDCTNKLENYYKIQVTFNTADSMGANFINSCLEEMSAVFLKKANDYHPFVEKKNEIKVIMSILSNYVPKCIVKAFVKCSIDQLSNTKNIRSKDYIEKFISAVKISKIDTYRAVTHNKGILNGIDAVSIATGNDFRAIEAAIHSYACKSGNYSGLSNAYCSNGEFTFELTIPIPIGTVGGLTNSHPLVDWNLRLLNKPTSNQLMQITACVGLAQNFAAINSLITTGIQKGHMKLHLINILNKFNVNDELKGMAILHFKNKKITYESVYKYLKLNGI